MHNAGSVFLGSWSPEPMGDYCSGTNHVLPTYGYARAYSGLSVQDFTRRMTVQELSAEGLRDLGPTAITLARLEGLDAHAAAVELRLAACGASMRHELDDRDCAARRSARSRPMSTPSGNRAWCVCMPMNCPGAPPATPRRRA